MPPGSKILKVLIVDDTPANLRLLRAVLEGEGMAVLEARDGVEGLAVLERENVDAIISDILMPNMDGYRFCHEVRRNPRLSHLPFIIYSSTYNSPADARLALEMGSDKFIKKPAPIHEITGALEEIISQPRPRPAPIEPSQELSLAKLYNETLVNKLEQKNQELTEQTEALRVSEEKFRQLAENMSEVCWVTAADFSELLYINPVYEKVWGRSCRSLYQNPRSFLEGVHEADREIVKESIAVYQRGEKHDVEFRVIQPNGNVRWVHAKGTAIRDESGAVYRLAGIAEDITERKSTEEQLRQAQKMEAVGQLAGGVAHDFNNLLTIIGGNLELLLMDAGSLSAEIREYLGDIANATERAVTLNRQLLAFSRSEAMQMKPLDLNAVIANFARLLRRIVGEDVRVFSEFAPRLPAIKGDPGMIEQILMNLVVNARDAMPAGGSLTIKTEFSELRPDQAAQDRRRRPGKFAVLAVRDTGTGIKPEHMQRIFEPFFTTKGVGKGTGLGLATVFGIVEQHEGWIELTSEVNAGTEFRVFFPVTGEAAGSEDVEENQQFPGRGEKILVVEDEAPVRAVATEILRRHGYTVLEADSGMTARQIWTTEGPDIDLLLTDMVMPGGLTGLELAELLRLQKPKLKVLITSGYSSHLPSGEAMKLKGFAFLRKPFSSRSLAETVRRALDAP